MVLRKTKLKLEIPDKRTVTIGERHSQPQPQCRPSDEFVMPMRPFPATGFRKCLRVWAAILLGFFSGSAGLSQSDSARTSNPTPVVLITIDTLRWDRLGCYGARSVETPAMDALAAQGSRFEYALAQVPI